MEKTFRRYYPTAKELTPPDVWLKRAPTDGGFEYYEIVCVYVDDVPCISKDTKALIRVVQESYEMKEGSIKPPDTYLGATMEKAETKEGVSCWAMSPEAYMENAIKIIEALLQEEGDKTLEDTLSL